MNPNLARLVVIEAFHASGFLGNLVPLLKECLTEEEYTPYAQAIGSCLSQINEAVLQRIYAEHPGLEQEINQNIEAYGRAF